MSDFGDMWRERRVAQKKARRTFAECQMCVGYFGTGTLVPPGMKCRRCGHDPWPKAAQPKEPRHD